ncbi:VPLPA-CTERM sorting domain-containing protein [Roseobacter sinensis]|uniref:VPLPA-CTERM sorting domain-containing protein n=1 Tax=Roseobacter sinensis TaxID=2931391 RepID=A0ABT3BAQ0_9RHOB|nr:VPLPA-CTERM sorting domain-containing protein [Roseobacter sp. WL0113]MCV3270632.1 VPLPA-CTERM sorting domain-containing protein [Roseobacter sp. WL0113]
MSIWKLAGAAALTLACAFGANAATITVTTFDAGNYNSSLGAAGTTGEDFEALGGSMGEGEVGASLSTAVGTFESLGGTGTGGSVIGTGTELALRDGTLFGRTNTVPQGGSWFLDSNDTWGMKWMVDTGSLFSKVSFVLNDGSDVGAFLRIIAGGQTKELRTGGKLPNGNARVVEIDFGQKISSAEIILGNFTTSGGQQYRLNDGFSVDGIEVSAVPLPASVLLLGAAIGGLGWAGRRRSKAA